MDLSRAHRATDHLRVNKARREEYREAFKLGTLPLREAAQYVSYRGTNGHIRTST